MYSRLRSPVQIQSTRWGSNGSCFFHIQLPVESLELRDEFMRARTFWQRCKIPIYSDTVPSNFWIPCPISKCCNLHSWGQVSFFWVAPWVLRWPVWRFWSIAPGRPRFPIRIEASTGNVDAAGLPCPVCRAPIPQESWCRLVYLGGNAMRWITMNYLESLYVQLQFWRAKASKDRLALKTCFVRKGI